MSLPLTAYASDQPAAKAEKVEKIDHAIALGDTTITLREFKRGTGPTFVRVHHNETDAGVVGERLVSELGGRFIDLLHPNGRNVSFKLDGARFWFDPNRIFTPEGIAKTLQGQRKNPHAAEAVKALADRILELCGNQPILVALHNNSGLFGLDSYMKLPLSRGIGRTLVNVGDGGNNNFVIVTTKELYTTFSGKNVSTVYQDPKYDLNDGSMSYRMGIEGKAYINLETLLGKRDMQWKMARDIHDFLSRATTASLE
ncbi:MAG: hypothetical protein AAB908_01875 [Patescibacteria group bacterium]